MVMQPLVSIVVLNWNGAQYIEKLITSLLKQSYDNYEILFIDNGSTDNSLDLIQAKFRDNCKLRILPLKKNYGFAKGNNIGFKVARGKYVIVLNNDTEVPPNFIEEMVRIAEADETVGAVGCKVQGYDGRINGAPVFMKSGFVKGIWEDRLSIYTAPILCLAPIGCAVLYRKRLIEILGGYDEDYWSDWEDYDLGWRIVIYGYKCVYTPLTYCLHIGGASYKGQPPSRMRRMVRNMLASHFKNYDSFNLVFRFPIMVSTLYVRLLLRIFTSLALVILRRKTKLDIYIAELLGIIDFFQFAKKMIYKRNLIQKNRRLSDRMVFAYTKEGITWP